MFGNKRILAAIRGGLWAAAAVVAFSLSAPAPALAQQRLVDRSFAAAETGELRLELKFGERIRVQAWNRPEITFEAVIEINGGRLNDALLLNYEEHSRGLTIRSDYDRDRMEQGRRSDCRGSGRSTVTWNDRGDDYTICSRIVYELKVPAGTKLEIETVSSDIELIGLWGPAEVKTVSGFIDWTQAPGRGAELFMKTVTGEVYSGLRDLQLHNRKRTAPMVGYRLKASLGSGGPAVRLESVSGDIYLRGKEY